MLKKAFMTEADLEDVARLEAIRARSAERERGLTQGNCCTAAIPPRRNAIGVAAESGDAGAYPHCPTTH